MAKTVFISRDLGRSSPFASRLCAAGWVVRGQSLVALQPLPLAEIPEADWIFFASQHAVRFFFNPTPGPSPEGEAGRDVDRSTPPLPFRGGAGGGVKLAALGPSTAREILQHTGHVDFTGTGDPTTTAAQFLPLASGQRVLFPAAQQSQKSIPRLLGAGIRAIFLDVYANTPVPDPQRIEADVLVFTSPLNARAYLSRHPLQADQRVVAIGRTTASTLAEYGIAEILVAAEPNELALADAVLALG